MAAPPRADRPRANPSRVLFRRVVPARSETSRIAVLVQERDGSRYVALVHEIRPRGGDWRVRRSVALAEALAGALNVHLAARPETTPATVRLACAIVTDAASEALPAGQPARGGPS